MEPKNYTILEADHDQNTMTIQIDSHAIANLERSQDEYTRKVADCSIIIAERGKTIHDAEFVREFNELFEKFEVWQENKDFIKEEYVIPAIMEEYDFDDRCDASWLVNYDRSNKVIITEIHSLSGKLIFESAGYTNGISPTRKADFNFNIVSDIYNDICDRGLKTDANAKRVEELGSLRTDYSLEKRDSQMDFYDNHVIKILNGLKDEGTVSSYEDLVWECAYNAGRLRIVDNSKNNITIS